MWLNYKEECLEYMKSSEAVAGKDDPVCDHCRKVFKIAQKSDVFSNNQDACMTFVKKQGLPSKLCVLQSKDTMSACAAVQRFFFSCRPAHS